MKYCPHCLKSLGTEMQYEKIGISVMRIHGKNYFSEYENDPSNFVSVQKGLNVYWGTLEAIERYLGDGANN